MKGKLLLAATVALAAAALCYVLRSSYNGADDFYFPLRAARDLLRGADPYAHPYDVTTLPAPITTALFALPFVWLPDQLAAGLFMGLSTGLLAYGLIRDGPPWRLLLFCSPAYVYAISFVQWTPLLLAMAFYPALLPVALAKPHVALPLVGSGYVKITRTGVLLSISIGLASLVLMPSWPWRWWESITPYAGYYPVLLLAGTPLLVILLCWWDRDARLVFILSVIPQRMYYDQLALWLVPQTAGEMALLTASSWFGFFCFFFLFRESTNWTFWIVATMYTPTMGMVLKRSLRTPAAGTDSATP